MALKLGCHSTILQPGMEKIKKRKWSKVSDQVCITSSHYEAVHPEQTVRHSFELWIIQHSDLAMWIAGAVCVEDT